MFCYNKYFVGVECKMHAQDYLIQTSEDNPLNILQYESE
jgi:hypothetical protein